MGKSLFFKPKAEKRLTSNQSKESSINGNNKEEEKKVELLRPRPL